DVEHVYEVPLYFAEEGLDYIILKYLGLPLSERRLEKWENFVNKLKHPEDSVTIGIVGKYIKYEDSYKSLKESLVIGGVANNLAVNLNWIEAEELENEGPEAKLSDIHGILIPGGFGERGIEGKILAVKYAREKKIPFFGICLGMQVATIEYSRNVLGLKDATSTEFDKTTKNPIFYKLRDLLGDETFGGNMRLGKYDCIIKEGTTAEKAYGTKLISERHRHRYEFNPAYKDLLEQKGLTISGISPDNKFIEIVEIKDHPWFLGCQFHPEFKSKPLSPHPLFRDFIKASYQNRLKMEERKTK
ncbi:MAG: CTP synthase, partial [Acidobacteria bacterium]|nr:CTP synthase [Acidobacteriota bacterium]